MCIPSQSGRSVTYLAHFVYIVRVTLFGRPLQALVDPLAGRGSCRLRYIPAQASAE